MLFFLIFYRFLLKYFSVDGLFWLIYQKLRFLSITFICIHTYTDIHLYIQICIHEYIYMHTYIHIHHCLLSSLSEWQLYHFIYHSIEQCKAHSRCSINMLVDKLTHNYYNESQQRFLLLVCICLLLTLPQL